MALLVTLICALSLWDLRVSEQSWVSTSDNNDYCPRDIAHGGTCPIALIPVQTPICLEHDINLTLSPLEDLPRAQSIMALDNFFIVRNRSDSTHDKDSSCRPCATKQKLLIVLLLFISGVHPNPGPEPGTQCIQTPSDFKCLSGLRIVHLNARSMLSKMDMICLWVRSTDAEIAVISESWLTKSVMDNDIDIDGYNVYRADRLKKGGGVAIYVKCRHNVTVVSSVSISKQLELLALNVEISKGLCLTVVGCYRPPSASQEALQSLTHLLSSLKYSEIVLVGDLNWDWLKPVSDEFKLFCDSVNLTQLVKSPTRPNMKCIEKSTLLDLILTNAPHKFSAVGVFCNDLSDHCVVGAIRNTKVPKLESRVISKRNMKHFCEQGFHYDLFHFNWNRIELIPDVETAWSFFSDSFQNIVNKHAPIRKYRVKGRDNPWFSPELSDSIHERNLAWAKARNTSLPTDWLAFKQLRNKCSSLIKKSKSEYYLSITTENLNDPRRFWKTIKSLSVSKTTHTLPTSVMKDSVAVHDKFEILNCFNEHFVSAGFLFESAPRPTVEPIVDPVFSGQPFNFVPFTVQEVHRALKNLDPKKSAGPDHIDPYFLNVAADFIVRPLTCLLNMTLENKEIPKTWKSAFVLPILKGGDPAILNNYRPISNLSVLAKILEALVANQLKDFLNTNAILSTSQSGFRKQHSTISAALKVVNDISGALDKKQHCASLFIDLSKAFDTVDHDILKTRLHNSGLSEQAVAWFSNYLSNRSQCIRYDGLCSDFVPIRKGVPQGSVLGPLLFTLYINNLGKNMVDADCHFYADDTVVYCFALSLVHAIERLQIAFDAIQNTLLQLKLILNVDKTKLMLFSKSRCRPQIIPSVVTGGGGVIEVVKSYKYLGIMIDDSLTFKPHVETLVKKLRLKLGFYFRNRMCFSFNVKKRLVEATFLPVLDYGDHLYMHASSQCLHRLDTVYHASLRFITNCKVLTHHCDLYSRVGWPALATRRLCHWYIFIYKAILRLLPSYLCVFIIPRSVGQYSLRSQDFLTLSVPHARTELGKRAFAFSAPTAWNKLQNDLRLDQLITLNAFKTKMKELEADLITCRCF